MKKEYVLVFAAVLMAVFIGGCGCGGDSDGSPAAGLRSIEVAPANPTIALGTDQQFTATGVFSDNSTRDLTQSVTWSSSDTSVATVSNMEGSKGLSNSSAGGSTIISASMDGISGSTTLTVTSVTLISIEVTPANPTVALGTDRQFTATGIFSDNSTQDLTGSVSWSSSEASVATISNAIGFIGLATSRGPGSTVITASKDGISGSTTLTVTSVTLISIEVTPPNPTVALGTDQQFTATGIFSDNSTENLTESVTWSSADASVATISNAAGSRGLASSAGAGFTIVTATQDGITGSANLTVSPAELVSIEITPVNPAIVLGMDQQFTATGIFSDSSTQDLTQSVTWSSSDASVATISNAEGSKGVATAVSAGTTIIAAMKDGVSGTTTLTVTGAELLTITVTPTNPLIGFNKTIQFHATGLYSDGSSQDITQEVTWSSSDTSVATISNAPGSKGLATSDHVVGSTIITATLGNISGSTTLRDP